jgi:hypothetical protein
VSGKESRRRKGWRQLEAYDFEGDFKAPVGGAVGTEGEAGLGLDEGGHAEDFAHGKAGGDGERGVVGGAYPVVGVGGVDGHEVGLDIRIPFSAPFGLNDVYECKSPTRCGLYLSRHSHTARI